MTYASVTASKSALNSKTIPRSAPTLNVDGQWYCSIPAADEQFITDTAARIAIEWNCSRFAIRSAIHNTTVSTFKGGKREYARAPWHFTVEFQHRQHGNWMAAHVYTDTRTVRFAHIKPRHETHGLQTQQGLRRDGIMDNPELFTYRNPKCRKMKPVGDPFQVPFSAVGYRPKDW